MSNAPETVKLAMFAGLIQKTGGPGSVGYVRADLYEQQAAEIERLMERNRELEKAVGDVVETWYWWRDDPIDRCRSDVEAAISEAGELIPPKEKDDG